MLKLFNSLTKKVEEFKPIADRKVGLYACGPTVYQFAHIGNFRSYMTSDILARVLQYNGYSVRFIMNITDVGHLVSDADTGEDKLEKSAKKEGKTAWEVAEFYTEAFLKDYEALHLTKPTKLCKATDHIGEQIELIKAIEAHGYTYRTSDGIYFDTSLMEDYGKLSSFDKDGASQARVEANDEKKNPRDFALWKFSERKSPQPPLLKGGVPQDGGLLRRDMEWKSPWGKGFPGWHIECTAMSQKYLGETFDIHTGGVDHKEIHHPNEIAQAEAVTHKPLAHYWLHTAFMLVAGEKMSKSLGNTYTLYDLEKGGYHPLALRYFYMQASYRQEMNFTYPALDAASNALRKLYEEVARWDIDAPDPGYEIGLPKVQEGCPEFEERFLDAINDDLNMPKALAVVWELVKSDKPSAAKAKTLFKMDEILGFDLQEVAAKIRKEEGIIPGVIHELVEERNTLRKQRRFSAADQIRAQIERLGYEIEDTPKGVRVKKI